MQDALDLENPARAIEEATDDGKLYETIWALEFLLPI
jgi:hypothetical protein